MGAGQAAAGGKYNAQNKNCFFCVLLLQMREGVDLPPPNTLVGAGLTDDSQTALGEDTLNPKP